jgi:hypothetical protein
MLSTNAACVRRTMAGLRGVLMARFGKLTLADIANDVHAAGHRMGKPEKSKGSKS